MRIEINTILHEEQRYPTVGDWELASNKRDPFILLISVSEMQKRNYEFLVGLHEMIEGYLCQQRGISELDVSAFDRKFEDARVEGNTDEPGDDPNAPYRREHFFATSIERLMAAELGVDWARYEEAINSL